MEMIRSDALAFKRIEVPAKDTDVVRDRPKSDLLLPPYEVTDNNLVVFNLYYPSAKSLIIKEYKNSKTHMLKKNNDYWHGQIDFGIGFVPMQIIIDGSEIISQFLPIGFGGNRPINFIDIPEKELWKLTDVKNHGSVVQDFICSKMTGAFERIVVYLPAEYFSTERINQSYPVLYLQHGHGENEMCWVSQGKMNFLMDEMIENEDAVPAIVVMANGMIYEEDEKSRLLCHRHFTRFLTKELIPYIDGKYRTKADKEHRAMAGLSMGSLQTSIATMEHSELFSYVGVFSGFVADFITGDTDYLSKDNIEKFKYNIRLYYRAIGSDDEYMRFFLSDDALLNSNGIDCIRTIHEGAHEWIVWRKCFMEFAKLIFH